MLGLGRRVQLSSRLSSQVGLLLSAEAGVLSPTLIAIAIAIAIARLRQSMRVGETGKLADDHNIAINGHGGSLVMILSI